MNSTVDFAELKINLTKFRADGEKYFNLFNKHIPTNLNSEAKILLYKIGNLTTIAKIIEKNSTAIYYIYDRKCIYEGMRAVCPYAKIVSLATGSQEKYDLFENKNMKFDCIIMNPPYSSGLHVKILAEAMNHIVETGKIVSLQPIDKWQKALLFDIENPVAGSVVIDRFTMNDICSIFNSHQRCELGILANFGLQCKLIDNVNLLNKLKRKLHQLIINNSLLLDNLEISANDRQYGVAFGFGVTIAGHGGRGKACYRLSSPNEDTALRLGDVKHAKKYYAKTRREQHLVWKFYQNPIMRFIAKEFGFGGIPYSIIPFLTAFIDENHKTPLDAEWSVLKLAKLFELDKADLELIKKSLNEYLYDYEKAEIETAIIQLNNSNI